MRELHVGRHRNDDGFPRREGGNGVSRSRLGRGVIGANILSDFASGIRDIVGGRSGSYEKKIDTGRQEATNDLRAEAHEVGADAVLGAALDYEEMGEGMLWVNISGTAVKTRRT